MLKDVLKVSSLRDIFNKKPKMNDTDFDKCNLTIGSFNCRSVKSSFDEVRNLCQYCDYVFLQQHWLLPRELNILFSIHPDCLEIGYSSVYTSVSVLTGRPYGGTGILYRKSFSPHISLIMTYDSRITALTVQANCGHILFMCVYICPLTIGTQNHMKIISRPVRPWPHALTDLLTSLLMSLLF